MNEDNITKVGIVAICVVGAVAIYYLSEKVRIQNEIAVNASRRCEKLIIKSIKTETRQHEHLHCVPAHRKYYGIPELPRFEIYLPYITTSTTEETWVITEDRQAFFVPADLKTK